MALNADERHEGPLTRPLSGSVHVGGAKNSALKLMAAATLTAGLYNYYHFAPAPRSSPSR